MVLVCTPEVSVIIINVPEMQGQVQRELGFWVFFKHLVGLKGNSDKASYHLRQDLVCVENVIIKDRRREDFFPSPKIITLSFLQPRDNRSIFLTVAAISTSEHRTN